MPSLRRNRFDHPDGVRVVETQRPAHSDSARLPGPPQAALVADSLAREDLARDRAGVLGVNVELVRLEGVKKDLRPAQLATMQSPLAPASSNHAPGDLAQDHRLGEDLRSHPDRRPGSDRPRAPARASKHQFRASRLSLGLECQDLPLGADELSDERLGRLIDQFLERPALDDPAVAHAGGSRGRTSRPPQGRA